MRIATLTADTFQLELAGYTLEAIGHDYCGFDSGAALFHELRRETFDLLILDWELTDITGPEVVTWIRTNLQEHLPILFMTNCNSARGLAEGLTAGADDFMMKPVHVGELATRVNGLLRRKYATEQKPERREWGRYLFRPADGRLEINGEPVSLTKKEFDLAFCLFQNKGRVLSRSYLLDTLWPVSNPVGSDLMSRSLDTHISRVRSALGLNKSGNGYRLIAEYGKGYRLVKLNPN